MLTLGPDGLTWRGETVPHARITGFVERHDPWTGRLWLEVRGPGWWVPLPADWGTLRRALRAAFPDRPFHSEWEDGRFPAHPLGLPVDPLFFGAAAVVALAAAVVTGVAGPLAGLGAALTLGWPVARLRDHLELRPLGLRAGPVWSPLVPWDEVHGISLEQQGRTAILWGHTDAGALRATVPAALVPAVRARVRRLGGLTLGAPDPLALRYERWRAPAAGIPWGVGVATALAAPWTAAPWGTLTVGLAVVVALVTLGQAAEARATGWGFGAILWLIVLYGELLAALALGT